MSDDLARLENWAGPLLAQLQPAARTRVARRVGMALRRAQQRRIAAQQDPDGTPYAPRRTPPAAPRRTGRIKRRAMFAKLRQARHLRVSANAAEVAVGFTGRVARIARVHQEGLTDTVTRGGKRVTYAKRRLLGFSAADIDLIERELLEHLAGR